MVRHETLGTDRLNRLYWHLNTLPDTILVEDTNEGVWSVININNQLVHQVLVSTYTHSNCDNDDIYFTRNH